MLIWERGKGVKTESVIIHSGPRVVNIPLYVFSTSQSVTNKRRVAYDSELSRSTCDTEPCNLILTARWI